jgi:hypothetical protein
MLILYCERHGHPMLVGYRRIRRVANGDDGLVVDWECYCGWHGTWKPERLPRSATNV